MAHVDKSFGGIKALDDCSMTVDKGSITGLIGPNGAGKTTLFDIISGFQQPLSGSIVFNQKRIDRLEAYKISQSGLSRTFQIPREFRRMTVLENLLAAAKRNPGENLGKVLFRRNQIQRFEHEISERAISILDFVSLIKLKNEYAGNLSSGQKKLLELGRALATNPSLLLLDEPTAGVNPTLARELMNMIRKLRDQGMTFFVIEHNMSVMQQLCDVVYAMDKGSVIARCAPDAIRNDKRIVESFLGA